MSADYLTLDVVGRLQSDPGADHDVTTELSWSLDMPEVIGLGFRTPSGRVIEWEVGRELVQAALDGERGGIGDVTVSPVADDRLAVRLFSPSGEAVFSFPRAQLGRFLFDTYRAVPPGAFGFDENELQRLLLDG